jgi:hypothetical protein
MEEQKKESSMFARIVAWAFIVFLFFAVVGMITSDDTETSNTDAYSEYLTNEIKESVYGILNPILTYTGDLSDVKIITADAVRDADIVFVSGIFSANRKNEDTTLDVIEVRYDMIVDVKNYEILRLELDGNVVFE